MGVPVNKLKLVRCLLCELTLYVLRFASAIILIPVVRRQCGLGVNVSLQLVVLFWEPLRTLRGVNWLEEARSLLGSPWGKSLSLAPSCSHSASYHDTNSQPPPHTPICPVTCPAREAKWPQANPSEPVLDRAERLMISMRHYQLCRGKEGSQFPRDPPPLFPPQGFFSKYWPTCHQTQTILRQHKSQSPRSAVGKDSKCSRY